MTATPPLPVVVLISGRGSNLQSIIDAVASGTLPIEICAVISNRPDAAGLQRATQAGITTEVIAHSLFEDRASFDQALQTCIDRYQPALVVLAGFMRILTPGFVTHYQGRLLNIHPSLLPDFPGLNTHQRALAAGSREHGASIHFVTGELDGGPVISQVRIPVLPGDDKDSLAARLAPMEHRLVVSTIGFFSQHSVECRDAEVVVDARKLSRPLRLQADGSLS